MHEASQNLLAVWLPAVVAIALVTLARAAAIYPCCLLFVRSSLRGIIHAYQRLYSYLPLSIKWKGISYHDEENCDNIVCRFHIYARNKSDFCLIA
jgi:hypothetical protein